MTENIVIGKYTKIHSKVQDEDRKLLIHLPPGYEQAEDRYPVLYVLGADFESMFLSCVSAIDYLSECGLSPSMIVVGLTTTDHFRDNFPKELEDRPIGGGSDSFLQFIGEELIPFVDEQYRTNSYRILYGGSNAGMLTVYALLAKPDLFSAYIASSPMLGWFPDFFNETATKVFSEKEQLNKFLYMTYGASDYQRALDEVPKFTKLLEESSPSELTWKSVILENEGHVPYTSLHDGIRTLFPDWRPTDERIVAMGLSGIMEHYNHLSEKYGIAVTIPEDVITTLAGELFQQDNKDEALSVMKTAVEIYPNSDRVHYFLGALYHRTNKIELAIKSLERSLELNPENQNVAQRLEQVRSEQ
ncbi:MAG: alpha/beta hydrolase-fold protein [Candidatus Thorarchaeota archaeon]|jgi:predicted alpha/beta superfamily hydrolase